NINNNESYQCESSYINDFLENALEENKYLISWIPSSNLKIVSKVGKGGFSTVYLAQWDDDGTANAVALKLLHGSHDNCEELLKEFNIAEAAYDSTFNIESFESLDEYLEKRNFEK
ncbi:3711_t:CDS:2, partial [Racocetra fulgida]